MSALRGRFRDVGTKSTDLCCGVLPTPIVPLDERNLLVHRAMLSQVTPQIGFDLLKDGVKTGLTRSDQKPQQLVDVFFLLVY